MKGTLHKTESGWQVWYHAKDDLYHGSIRVRILPLLSGDELGLFIQDTDSKNEGKEVEFEIVEFPVPPTNGPVSNSISKYAKLVDKATRPLTEKDAWPEYPTRLQQLQIQIAEECFRKYPNNEILYPTDELKDAYKAGVIDGLRECRLDSYNPPTKKQDNSDKKYSEQDIQNVLDGFTNEAPGEYIKTNFIGLLNKQY